MVPELVNKAGEEASSCSMSLSAAGWHQAAELTVLLIISRKGAQERRPPELLQKRAGRMG